MDGSATEGLSERLVLEVDHGALAANRAAFDRAWETRPDLTSESLHHLCGAVLRLRVVGRALARAIRPSLAHLEIAESYAEPALTIDVWDHEETGVEGRLERVPDGLGPYGIVIASKDGRIVAEVRWYVTSYLDRAARRIVSGVKSAERLYLDQRARPFHRLLSVAFQNRDLAIIHSGLVSHEERGVLFAGKGGSGKSTTSILCLRDGFRFLGDDFVGLQAVSDGSFVGHSLYSTTVVDLDHLRRFPEFITNAIPSRYSDEFKSMIYLTDIFPNRIERRVSIGAVVLPRVVDGTETVVRPASKGEAMLGLAPSSLMTATGARSIDLLGDLVTGTPCFWLDLGGDMDRIPDLVAQLLTEEAR